MKSITRKMPIIGALLALVCAVAVDAAEAKTAPKKSPVKRSVVAKKRAATVVNHPLGHVANPKAPEYYGYPKPRPIYSNYRIDGNIPNAAYYGNTYGYSYGPRTIPYPNSSYQQQQASPDYLMRYGQYVQQYNKSNDMPSPYGFAPGSYPSNRYDAKISEKERWERDRVYSSQVAMHALILYYGTREGKGRFYTREELTQEAIRYADLLRYGMTHTYTNPETNIAP